MKEKILKAFQNYKDGIRPQYCGSARYAFVLNPKDNELYPIKIVWALANNYDSTSSFNTRTAAKELDKYGFKSINIETGYVYPFPEESFSEQVKHSLNDSAENRKKRLEAKNKFPIKKIVEVIQFQRSPDVVAEVLIRAKGYCEKCKKKAPFIRKSDLTPYLEVHHIIPLSNGGEDTVENCLALCPNCHREEHFG